MSRVIVGSAIALAVLNGIGNAYVGISEDIVPYFRENMSYNLTGLRYIAGTVKDSVGYLVWGGLAGMAAGAVIGSISYGVIEGTKRVFRRHK